MIFQQHAVAAPVRRRVGFVRRGFVLPTRANMQASIFSAGGPGLYQPFGGSAGAAFNVGFDPGFRGRNYIPSQFDVNNPMAMFNVFRPFSDDAIPVDGPTVTAADVITRVRLNGGSLTVGQGEYMQVAQNNPALFTLTPAGPDTLTIRERSTAGMATNWTQYALWAGLAIGAVALLKAIRD